MFFGTRKKPRGPLGKWDTHTLKMSGTLATFKAPQHNHEVIQPRTSFEHDINIYDPNNFGPRYKDDKAEPHAYGLAIKDWAWWGLPLIDGGIGDVKFKVALYHFPEFKSLFHPRALECAVERYIYASSDETQYPGKARLNWQVLNINDIKWVSYEVELAAGIYNAEEVTLRVLQTPVSEEHLLTVLFKQIIRKPNTTLSAVYDDLIHQVLSSFELHLSEDAIQSRRAVQAAYSDVNIAETLAPYDFELIRPESDWEMFTKISREAGESLTYEEKEAETQKRLKEQARSKKESQEKELSKHLRFKERL